MLKSINYWSYPGGLEGTLPLADFFRNAKAHGFPVVEVAIFETGVINFETTEADCAAIVALAAEHDVQIASVASGTYWSFGLGDASVENRTKAKDALERMIQITQWLGCTTLLTILGSVDVFFLPERPAQPYDEVLRNATEGLREILPVAEAHGVRLGIENVWNKFLLSPTEMASFIDSFDSPSIGAYFDVGNILPYGYPEHWLTILGHRVVGVHFKDFRRSVGTADGFVDLLEGDVNWPAVMTALRSIGYAGPVVAEMIPGYRFCPEVRLANTSNAMDAILGLP